MEILSKALDGLKEKGKDLVLEKLEEKATRVDAIVQYSTIKALQRGVIDGFLEADELKENGDTGIGTFHGVSGIMVMLDGKVYQIDENGNAEKAGRGAALCFAAVTFFERNIKLDKIKASSLQDFTEQIQPILKKNGVNMFFSTLISGKFSEIRLKSYAATSDKYSTMEEQLAGTERVYSLNDVEGTLVGFRYPIIADSLEQEGWTFHFLSSDCKKGGRLIDFREFDGKCSLDMIRRLNLTLPNTKAFNEFDHGI